MLTWLSLELQRYQPHHPSQLIEGDIITQADLHKPLALFIYDSCSPYYSLPYTHTWMPVLTPHTYYEVGSGHQPIACLNYSRVSKDSDIVPGTYISILILPHANCVA